MTSVSIDAPNTPERTSVHCSHKTSLSHNVPRNRSNYCLNSMKCCDGNGGESWVTKVNKGCLRVKAGRRAYIMWMFYQDSFK